MKVELTDRETSDAKREAQRLLEAEHGPLVFLSLGTVEFAFKRMTREEYTTRRNRVRRGDVEADDRLLQERCITRDAWNAFVAESTFEPMAFVAAYRDAHGGAVASESDPDEIPDGGTAARWISNGRGDARTVFGFRKPGRAEVKLFQAQLMAEQRGEKLPNDPVETLLRSCGESPEFGAWLEENLFGVSALSEAFLAVFGLGDVQDAAKK